MKPFDPAEGCYIRLADEGKVSRGLLEKGPAGFCLVGFEDEEPFPSEVPNLWLALQAAESGLKLKRVRATGNGGPSFSQALGSMPVGVDVILGCATAVYVLMCVQCALAICEGTPCPCALSFACMD